MGETCLYEFHPSGWLRASALTCRSIPLDGVRWSCLRINENPLSSYPIKVSLSLSRYLPLSLALALSICISLSRALSLSRSLSLSLALSRELSQNDARPTYCCGACSGFRREAAQPLPKGHTAIRREEVIHSCQTLVVKPYWILPP